MHAVYCTTILCLTILVSCQIEEEQSPQDLSPITEEVFHQIASEVIKKANESIPPPPPPVPPQKDTAHQSDIEESMRIWKKKSKARWEEWREKRKAEHKSRKGKQHVVVSPKYVSNPMETHRSILRKLNWNIPDHPSIKILKEEFPEQDLDYRVKAYLEFERDTVVLNVEDKPMPALMAELNREKIIPMGFLQLNRVQLSDDGRRFLVYGNYVVRWDPWGFGYIFQWKNGKWEKEVSSIYPIH